MNITATVERFTPKIPQWAEILLVLLLNIALFLVLFYPALTSWWELMDDHESLRLAASAPLHSSGHDITQPIDYFWTRAFDHELQLGRFRPVYYVFRFAEAAVWQTNAFAYHLWVLSIGVVTSTLLYALGKRLGLRWWAGLILIAWFVVQRGSSEIWFRLGPAETRGMFFVVLTLWSLLLAAEKGKFGTWHVMSLVLMLLTNLIKEPFTLLLPAYGVFYVTLYRLKQNTTWVAAFQKNLLFGGLVAMLFVGYMAFLQLVVTAQGGYGADSVQSSGGFQPFRWLQILLSANYRERFGYYTPFAAFLIAVVLQFRNRRVSGYVIAATVIMLFWVVPQILVYDDLVDNRYGYPLLLGLAGLSAFALNALWERNQIILLLICFVFSGFWGVRAADQTNKWAVNYWAVTEGVRQMAEYVAENQPPPNQNIVFNFEPESRPEAVPALWNLLGFAGVDAPLRFDMDQIAANEIDDVGMVIFMYPTPRDWETAPSWFVPEDYTQHTIEVVGCAPGRSGCRKVGRYEWVIFSVDS